MYWETLIYSSFNDNKRFRFERSDGRVQYPLILIFVSPNGGAPRQMMAYSGSRNQFRDSSKISKVFDVRDLEDLTQEWLDEKLKNFWIRFFLTVTLFSMICAHSSSNSFHFVIFFIMMQLILLTVLSPNHHSLVLKQKCYMSMRIYSEHWECKKTQENL